MAGTEQQQIREHRNAKGFLNAPLLPTHLVCTQSQVRLEFPIDLLSWYIRIHVCLGAASLFSRDELENGEEMRSSSGSIYTLQTARN